MNDAVRLEKSLLIDYLKEFENYCLGKTDRKSYLTLQERRACKLWELCPDQQIYHLMQAAALIRCGKLQEGEEILKKYEKKRVLQFRNTDFRA